MTRPPTYDDANLLLKLYKLRRETVMRDARKWYAGEFKAKTLEEWRKVCPLGSQMNAWWRQVTSYWEMVSSMVTSGVLHPELFAANSMEALMVWVKVEPFIGDLRAAYKNPGSLKNLEKAAGIVKEYLKAQGPEAYDAFLSRWR